jgi:hypothetical protein
MLCLLPKGGPVGYGSVLSALVLMALGCEPPPDFVAPETPGAAGDLAQTPRRLRRLSNREYDNVVRDLIGDMTAPARAFLADAFATGYDNGPADLIVQSDHIESYQLAAEALAATAVAERRDLLLGGCDPATQGDDACVAAFLDSFAPRAFRRPLTDGEQARLRSIYDLGVAAGGFPLGIEMALETVLQSPQFLYREELGAPADPGQVRLTPYELASELSFLVTGSLPDDVLWSTVQAGGFTTVDDFRREATRLLATPSARDNLRAFFHEWLATNRLLPTMTVKDTKVYPTWNRALLTSMSGELDRLFASVLSGDTASLRALFSTPEGFVDPALAPLYGVDAPDSGFEEVALDPAIRPGILARAGFLAVHADSDSSGPVARGVFLMSAILCYPPLPRPATVPPPPSVDDANKAGQTTRQRFSQHASDGACRGCHQIIDGIGFGFEAFDGMGVYRSAENGHPIDASGVLLGSGDPSVDGPFDGVSGLVDHLLAGNRLSDCFARQLFRFAMGAVETPADEPLVAALGSGFSVDSRMTDVLLALVSSPGFTDRITVGGGP